MSERQYTEDEVDELRRASALEARIDEINRFVTAGTEQQLYSVRAIQTYFLGRTAALAYQLVTGESADE